MNDSGENTYRRFLGGDGGAMKELIRLYRPGLTFFVYGLLKDSAETEEIVEDCFVELVLHPKKYNFASSLKTYLFALARYKTANRKRYLARRAADELDETLPSSDPDIVSGIVKSERDAVLWRCIGRLNDDYRNALLLYYFEDMSCEGIAGVMKKNRKQVANLLSRGRAALRSELEKEGVSGFYED